MLFTLVARNKGIKEKKKMPHASTPLHLPSLLLLFVIVTGVQAIVPDDDYTCQDPLAKPPPCTPELLTAGALDWIRERVLWKRIIGDYYCDLDASPPSCAARRRMLDKTISPTWESARCTPDSVLKGWHVLLYEGTFAPILATARHDLGVSKHALRFKWNLDQCGHARHCYPRMILLGGSRPTSRTECLGPTLTARLVHRVYRRNDDKEEDDDKEEVV